MKNSNNFKSKPKIKKKNKDPYNLNQTLNSPNKSEFGLRQNIVGELTINGLQSKKIEKNLEKKM